MGRRNSTNKRTSNRAKRTRRKKNIRELSYTPELSEPALVRVRIILSLLFQLSPTPCDTSGDRCSVYLNSRNDVLSTDDVRAIDVTRNLATKTRATSLKKRRGGVSCASSSRSSVASYYYELSERNPPSLFDQKVNEKQPYRRAPWPGGSSDSIFSGRFFFKRFCFI